jgi:predicted phosphodiesterase
LNVLVIGDTHEPFTHKNYLDFCLETKKKFHCEQVVHIGDLVDNHAISYHDHDPNGMSPKDEMLKAKQNLKKWFKAFPKVRLCKGNHDILATRKFLTHGLPTEYMRDFEEVWELPRSWEYRWDFYLCGVKYQHGTGYGGTLPHMACANANRQSTVIGHCHSVSGVNYSANDKSLIFGMSTGCGIDRMQYAFWYGKDFKCKPIVSCGVILESGRIAEVIPMRMG